MVDFNELSKTIIHHVGEAVSQATDALNAMVPAKPVVFSKTVETGYVIGTSLEPNNFRPKTDLNGAERIESAFAGLPVVPGKIDVAYDPIAKLNRAPVLALRVNGYVWVGTIDSFPANGTPLGEWLKTAHLNRSGFSRTSFNIEDILGNLRPEVSEGMSQRGVEQNLSLVSDNGFRLQVQTVPEHTRKTTTIDMTFQLMELGQNLLLSTPVSGAATAEPQARMLQRLPLQFRDGVMRDMYGIPNIPRVVMTYGASYPARLGLRQLEGMPKGFEVPAEPLPEPKQSPVQSAGLLPTFITLAFARLRRRLMNFFPALPPPPAWTLAGAASWRSALHVVITVNPNQPFSFNVGRKSGEPRIEDGTFAFNDQKVSRNHASVEIDPRTGVLIVRDNNSSNGSSVDLMDGRGAIRVNNDRPVQFRIQNATNQIHLMFGEATITLQLQDMVVPAREARVERAPVSIVTLFELARAVTYRPENVVTVVLPNLGRPVDFEVGRGSVGSVIGNKIRVDDPRVSSNHLRLRWNPTADLLQVYDLGSKNGTMVQIGHLELKVEQNGDREINLSSNREPVVLRIGGTAVTLYRDGVTQPEASKPLNANVKGVEVPQLTVVGMPVVRVPVKYATQRFDEVAGSHLSVRYPETAPKEVVNTVSGYYRAVMNRDSTAQRVSLHVNLVDQTEFDSHVALHQVSGGTRDIVLQGGIVRVSVKNDVESGTVAMSNICANARGIVGDLPAHKFTRQATSPITIEAFVLIDAATTDHAVQNKMAALNTQIIQAMPKFNHNGQPILGELRAIFARMSTLPPD